MKINLVIYGALESVSGGYLYDRALVNHLRRAGETVEITSLPWRNYGRHLTDNFSNSLIGLLRDKAPDILLQDELNHPSLFLLNRRLREALNCPIISIVHHLRSSEWRPAWQNRINRWVERRYLETADGFIYNSRTTRAVVRGLLKDERPSVVAYPGGDHLQPRISDEKIRERCLQPGPLRILFVGNVIPRKGLHTLVTALARLPRRGWCLTVAGNLMLDNRYVKKIRRLISRSGLDDQITLLRTVPPDVLADLLESHHCLAVPSFYEGFGIVYLEAMGFGEAIIASTAGAVPEVVHDGREGFLVPPGDAVALAACIDRLIQDRDLLLRMSMAGRRRYLNHPTWADSAGRVTQFLRSRVMPDKKNH